MFALGGRVAGYVQFGAEMEFAGGGGAAFGFERGDLGEEGAVGASEVSTELSLPLGDLVDGDGVEL